MSNVTGKIIALGGGGGASEAEVEELRSAIGNKADAVYRASSAKNTFSADELEEYGDFIVESNASGFDNVVISKSEDVCPLTEAYTSSDNFFTKQAGVNSVHAEGERSSDTKYYAKYNAHSYLTPKEAISSGDVVRFALSVNGSITPATQGQNAPGSMIVKLQYTDESYSSESIASYNTSGGIFTGSLTAEKNVEYIYVTISAKKNYTFDVDYTWSVIKDATYIDVNIPEDGILSFTSEYVGENGFTIIPSTAVAKEKISVEEYVEEYVDGHVPEDMLTKEDLVYISPEMFGAKGDGTTDDTTAVQTCINNAISRYNGSYRNPIPVRGYGDYRISSGIDIVGSYTDIYLKNLYVVTGAQYGVKMSGRNNTLRIDYINAYGATSACGFRLENPETGDDCRYNNISFGRVDGYTNAVEYLSNQVSQNMYYNKLRADTVVARNGHCFYFAASANGSCNENSFWAKRLTCNNGYAVYNYEWEGSESNRFYEICIENNCLRGVYGYATLINCRTTECMDLKRPDNDSGVIFEFDGICPIGGLTDGTYVDYISVDVSNAMSLEDAIEMVGEYYDENVSASKSRAFDSVRGMSGSRGFVIGKASRLWNYYAVESGALSFGSKAQSGKIIAYYNHKGYVPDEDWETDVDVASYTPIVTETKVPTIFNINADTSIYLDYSYCCVGINKVKIVQKNGHKATVYDKEGNVIFNGTQRLDGEYLLECTRYDYTFTIDTQRSGEVTWDDDCKGIFFGPNETWTVTPINPSTPQWELINSETFTNATEADKEITLDRNGDAFELTSAILVFTTPVQETASSKGDYGRIRFWFGTGSNDYKDILFGDYTQSANGSQKSGIAKVTQEDGLLELSAKKQGGKNDAANVVMSGQIVDDSVKTASIQLIPTPLAFKKVTITKVTGTAKYWLYGKRKI